MEMKRLFRLWLPLAVSFELMMCEGPAFQAAIGRLAAPVLNLAAWSLTMSLSLLVESPVIMLLATAIALVRDSGSFGALRRFVVTLAGACTLLTAAVAFTPLFELLSRQMLGQPADVTALARPAMQIMLFWTAAIAWRRFYQGVLVRYGHTRKVSQGTLIRLISALTVSISLAVWKRVPGVEVGAISVMCAVVVEAIATTLYARPVLREQVLTHTEPGDPPRQRDILRFHAPLALTTLLTLAAPPLTAAALARAADPIGNLAAASVASMLLLVLRGWGLALQEITVAQSRAGAPMPVVRRFTWIVGGVTSAAAVLIAVTPLLDVYLGQVIHAPHRLWGYVHLGVAAGAVLPLLTALSAHLRGVLVAQGRTKLVYQGMGLNLAVHGAALTAGVAAHLQGMWIASLAYAASALAEYGYLHRNQSNTEGLVGTCIPIGEEFEAAG